MKVFDPLSDANRLNVSDEQSEHQLQAEIYSRLKRDGFVVSCGQTYKRARGSEWNSEFDLCVFRGKRCVAIIETKRTDVVDKIPLRDIEAITKYRHFSVPVVLFWDLEKYNELVSFLNDGAHEAAEDLQLASVKEQTARFRLRALHRRLDVASMAAYDVNVSLPNSPLASLEKDLEQMRDKVAAQQKELK